jgi:hypothetical protein
MTKIEIEKIIKTWSPDYSSAAQLIHEQLEKERNVGVEKMECGHYGLLSMFVDKNGKSQCTNCANAKRFPDQYTIYKL